MRASGSVTRTYGYVKILTSDWPERSRRTAPSKFSNKLLSTKPCQTWNLMNVVKMEIYENVWKRKEDVRICKNTDERLARKIQEDNAVEIL